MNVTLHEGLEALEGLKPEWQTLLATQARQRPFLLHEWVTTSWRHFARGDRLLTVCVRDEAGPQGLVALRQSRCLLGKTLAFAVEPADCRDLILRSGREFEVMEAFLRWLTEEFREWDLLRLRSVCVLSPTGRLLPVMAHHLGLPNAAWLASPCAYVDLPATLEEYLDHMPGQLRRKKHAQARRKLVREHGEPEFRAFRGPELTSEVMDRFSALHRRAWAQRGGSAAIGDERTPAFHRDLIAALTPAAGATVFMMSVEGRDAAAYYGFQLGHEFFAYMSAWDPALSVYSVGGQATLALIEHGIREGWTQIDLMKGAERYKFDYTRHCGQTLDHCLARSRRKMRLFCAGAALRGRLCA